MNFSFEDIGTLSTLFFVCFCAGVVYVTVSCLFSGVCERFDARRKLFKPSILAAFLMVFGGVGSVARHRTEVLAVAVGVAMIAALAVAYLLVRFIKAEN